LTEHGGHVGFLHGSLPGDPLWMPRRLLTYFEQQLPHAAVVPEAAKASAAASTPA
jgi:predicted alpha/beta-fold hydrolase